MHPGIISVCGKEVLKVDETTDSSHRQHQWTDGHIIKRKKKQVRIIKRNNVFEFVALTPTEIKIAINNNRALSH